MHFLAPSKHSQIYFAMIHSLSWFDFFHCVIRFIQHPSSRFGDVRFQQPAQTMPCRASLAPGKPSPRLVVFKKLRLHVCNPLLTWCHLTRRSGSRGGSKDFSGRVHHACRAGVCLLYSVSVFACHSFYLFLLHFLLLTLNS